MSRSLTATSPESLRVADMTESTSSPLTELADDAATDIELREKVSRARVVLADWDCSVVTLQTANSSSKAFNYGKRLLTAFLDFLPSVEGRAAVADDIEGVYPDLERFQELVEFYNSNIIIPARSQGGKTAPPSEHPNDILGTLLEDTHASGSTDVMKRNQEGFRNELRIRQGNRCAFTGLWDINVKIPDGLSPVPETADLEAAHILPFSLASEDRNDQERAKIWNTLWRLFPRIRTTGWNTSKINHASNGLLVTSNAHTYFGRMDLALQPTTEANKYKLLRLAPLPSIITLFLPPDDIIVFEQKDPRIPLPAPELLATHCAVARIFRASGAAEALEHVWRGLENNYVLSKDGTTEDFEVIKYRLLAV